jgi:hypothetical protein
MAVTVISTVRIEMITLAMIRVITTVGRCVCQDGPVVITVLHRCVLLAVANKTASARNLASACAARDGKVQTATSA